MTTPIDIFLNRLASPSAALVDPAVAAAGPRRIPITSGARPAAFSLRPVTYMDLAHSIEASLAIDYALVSAIAATRTQSELRSWAALGIVRDPDVVYGAEFTIVELMAKTVLDNEIALRARAKVSAAEQAARSLELAAELARTAIPPRPHEARTLALRADAVRRAVPAMAGE